MRFLGPRRYFGVQNPDVADDLRSWYDESERQFGAGRIRSGESGLPAGENVALVDQLGGLMITPVEFHKHFRDFFEVNPELNVDVLLSRLRNGLLEPQQGPL